MIDFLYDQFGRRRKVSDLMLVVRLEQLKQKSGSNPWPVIGECINVWSKRHPTKWKSYLYYLDEIRDTRKDSKYASTKDKTTGGILRYCIDIPAPVMKMIRNLYSPDELPMNREFFREFGKRFPVMQIPEKL